MALARQRLVTLVFNDMETVRMVRLSPPFVLTVIAMLTVNPPHSATQ